MKTPFCHTRKVEEIQKQIRARSSSLSLGFSSKCSNTARTKSYKSKASTLDFSSLNQILSIDRDSKIAYVEPRVTMQELLRATLPYGLMPPVVPEFKGITVGGAIMGGAGESSSHKWGGFNDSCISYELLTGDGQLLKLSLLENPDLFYGISGSYGSLGAVVGAEVKLIPSKPFVHLRMHRLKDCDKAICLMRTLARIKNPPDFIDGIAFAPNEIVIIEGRLKDKHEVSHLPRFSLSASSEWYFQHVQRAPDEEIMPLEDYLFRHDKGAFWMGSYLFHFPLLAKFALQGICNLWKPKTEGFTAKEVKRFRTLPNPSPLLRSLSAPLMESRPLWRLFHMAEKWIHDRLVLQDLCIPEDNAASFLQDLMHDPAVFPLWLCPIKGTREPQIFAPHALAKDSSAAYFINIGVYGLPAHSGSLMEMTKTLERKTKESHGRKVLYARSYYSEEEFWNIYSKSLYEALRERSRARGVWHEITEKVLSE